MTAADLARIFRVPLGTIYRWAHEDGWKRHGWPRVYDMDDVQESYDRRRHAA